MLVGSGWCGLVVVGSGGGWVGVTVGRVGLGLGRGVVGRGFAPGGCLVIQLRVSARLVSEWGAWVGEGHVGVGWAGVAGSCRAGVGRVSVDWTNGVGQGGRVWFALAWRHCGLGWGGSP